MSSPTLIPSQGSGGRLPHEVQDTVGVPVFGTLVQNGGWAVFGHPGGLGDVAKHVSDLRDASVLLQLTGGLLFQACRYGHVQHLEHLLFYGADMAAQNASGNTALHICALYNQVSGGSHVGTLSPHIPCTAACWVPCRVVSGSAQVPEPSPTDGDQLTVTFTILGAGGPRSGCRQILFLPRALSWVQTVTIYLCPHLLGREQEHSGVSLDRSYLVRSGPPRTRHTSPTPISQIPHIGVTASWRNCGGHLQPLAGAVFTGCHESWLPCYSKEEAESWGRGGSGHRARAGLEAQVCSPPEAVPPYCPLSKRDLGSWGSLVSILPG